MASKVIFGGKGYDPIAPGAVALAGSGADQEVIAAPTAEQKIVVYGLIVTAAAATTVQFQSGVTAISPALDVGPSGPLVVPMSESLPWLTCAAGAALQASTGAGGGCKVHAAYIVADA